MFQIDKYVETDRASLVAQWLRRRHGFDPWDQKIPSRKQWQPTSQMRSVPVLTLKKNSVLYTVISCVFPMFFTLFINFFIHCETISDELLKLNVYCCHLS